MTVRAITQERLEKIVREAMAKDEYYPGTKIPIFGGRSQWCELKIKRISKEIFSKLNLKKIGKMVEAVKIIRKVVNKQAKDDGIWFIPHFASEEYLQLELRKLHAVIENNTNDLMGKTLGK